MEFQKFPIFFRDFKDPTYDLDHVFFWNVADLEKKLAEFQVYFNRSRVHRALDGHTPAKVSGVAVISRAELHSFRWQTHCRGLYQLPVAA